MAQRFLSELQLSHFRSYELASLALDGRPVAVFGANGAGKTNLLEAVSLFSPGTGMRRAKTAEIARAGEGIGWKLRAVLQSSGAPSELETRAEPESSRTVLIDEKQRPQNALSQLVRMVWLIPAMDRLWIEGAEGRRRFLDRLTMSFIPSHVDVSVSYEKAMRQRNRLLKDMVRDPMWYKALEAQMAEAGAQIIENRVKIVDRLSRAMQDTQSAFPVVELSIDGPDESALISGVDAFLAALDESRLLDLRAGRTLVGPHRADLRGVYAAKEMEAKLCSTGEQKALLLSLILANARALSEDLGAAPILLLDEVAAHLDADRRAALYDEICALDAQAWMTGTGAELFAELGTRAQHFEVREDGGGSQILAAQ